jgi:hypothetical protein
MPSAGARFIGLFVATFTAATARGQATTWVVTPVALGGDVSSESTRRAGELLLQALASRPELTLVQLARQGALPDLSAARVALTAGREAYQRFQFQESEHQLGRAVELITQAGVPAGESQTLLEALTELATVEEMSGRHADAMQTCESLMVIRPDLTLDPVRVPPRVMQACEAARRRRALDVRRVTLTSTPPFVHLYVDGQPLGAEPVTVTLPIGRHYLFCVGPDQQTRAQALDVAPGGDTEVVRLELPEPPAAKLSEALRARVRRRGPLPQTLDAASALATVTAVERVIVSGLERDGADHWRLWAAAIDPARHVAPTVAVARLGDDLADAPPILARVAAALVTGRAAAGPARFGEATFAPTLDFTAALFGSAPETGVVAAPPRAQRERRRPYLWLWIGGAALVAAAAVTVGLAVGLDNGKLRVSW